ncbi:MAG: Gfo/Idh/MocA family oxidoreductase [Gemmataceae bacterium]|nr:Gfo/Idh/MocA family oxidoreductase [Gemmataceae bacterium]MCI0739648.1 Gfo/Idh/MocA family oxidoreductase [Gemmataceae bacterium]
MTRKLSRRRFMQSSALAAGAGYFLTAGVTESHAARQDDPMRRINVAVIGSGGQGGGNLGAVARTENIVALCDVDDERARGAYNKYPDVPKYKDFRIMLEKQKDIEAVVVSTPDHTHAHASIRAMRMGKHCYTEKPLTHSVWEARQMRETAAKHKVATQMGNQGTSNNTLREGVDVIRSGAIGDVREVHVWTNRPIWPQNIERPKERQEVPKGLDWDLWLGPAPERPYHRAYVPFAWRGWWDFGTGALGDMACHTMNLANMALSLGPPSAVSADVAHRVNNETAPMGCTVTYEFPDRTVNNRRLPSVRLMWYERRLPEGKLFHGQKPSGSGCLLIGARGTFYTNSDYGGAYRLLPEGDFQGFKAPEPVLPRNTVGHHGEWLRACKGGTPAMSNFVDYAGLFTETVLLGNVAMRVGKRVVWNSEKMQAVDLQEAAQYIRRPYRKGWDL